jgi:hypothetical protein
MRDTTLSLFRWFLVGFVMLLCFMLGMQHGESLGEAKTAEKMNGRGQCYGCHGVRTWI